MRPRILGPRSRWPPFGWAIFGPALTPVLLLGLAMSPRTSSQAAAESPATAATDPHAQERRYPVELVAAIGGHDDVLRTVFVGSSGQLYRPAANVIPIATDAASDVAPSAAAPPTVARSMVTPSGGSQPVWRREHGGGIATGVRSALWLNGVGEVAAGRVMPPFRLHQRTWGAWVLPYRGRAHLAAGSPPALAAGRQVLLWQGGRWQRVGQTPQPAVDVAVSGPKLMYALGAEGQLWRLGVGGVQEHALAIAEDDRIVALVASSTATGRVFAISERGVVLAMNPRQTRTLIRPDDLRDFAIDAATVAPDGKLWLAGRMVPDAGRGPTTDAGEEGLIFGEPMVTTPPPAPVRSTRPGHALVRADGDRLRLMTTWPAHGTLTHTAPPIAWADIPHLPTIPITAPVAPIASVRVDRQGVVIWATKEGQIRYGRPDGPWKKGQIVTALPSQAPRYPTRRPAQSR